MSGAGQIDDRTPRPDPRVNAVAVLVVGAVAAGAYVAALFADVLPSQGSAIALFAVAPVLAAFAWAVIASRARAEDDDALRWIAAGLATAIGRVGEGWYGADVSLRFTTKFDAVDDLLGLPHGRRTRVRFSVNAEELAARRTQPADPNFRGEIQLFVK